MKQLLLLSIRAYWLLVPAFLRRRCLFRESCSRLVFREAKANGFGAGWTAFRKRHQTCRPGFCVYELPDGKRMVLLANGESEVIENFNPIVFGQ